MGANALDEEAVKSIFHAKERPYNDPIIAHVTSVKQALELTVVEEDVQNLFKFLAKEFWPGPMTVVMKANLDIIPMVLTGGTGSVGVRYPNNVTA